MPRNRDVFINCPYDAAYQDLFHAICFTLLYNGYRPRCALESVGSERSRLDKICGLIGKCAAGIHDISRVEASPNGLPRLNMPFELGLFIACKRFGGPRHRSKRVLVIDRDPHTHHASLSDLSGYDPLAHDGTIEGIVGAVSTWLRSGTREPIAGPLQVSRDFHLFRHDLPSICVPMGFDERTLAFGNLVHFMFQWIGEWDLSLAS